jgi:hypothetical protein
MPAQILLPFLAFFLILSVHAQQGNGHTAVGKSGIALVKPQSWSPVSQATVVHFTAYTDRSARATPGAGYFVLRLPGGTESQVKTAQIVKIIIRPDLPAELRSPSDRANLQKVAAELVSAADLHPSTRPALEDFAQPFHAAIARLDNGEICVDGQWQSLKEFTAREAATLEARLRANMTSAKHKKDFDFNSNPDFVRLLGISESDRTVRLRLSALQTQFKKLVSQEEQAAILAQLGVPGLPRAEVTDLVTRLKNLPDLEISSRMVIEQAARASRMSDEVDAIKAAFEAHFAIPAKPGEGGLPSSGIVSRLRVAEANIREWLRESPPAAIWIPEATVKACVALVDGLPAVEDSFATRDYAAAASALSPLVDESRQVGQATSAALVALHSFANAEQARFNTLLAQGDALASAGNKPEAIAKFTEALTIMPSQDVSERIEALKK